MHYESLLAINISYETHNNLYRRIFFCCKYLSTFRGVKMSYFVRMTYTLILTRLKVAFCKTWQEYFAFVQLIRVQLVREKKR